MKILLTLHSARLSAGLMSFIVLVTTSSVNALAPSPAAVPLTASEAAARISAIAVGRHKFDSAHDLHRAYFYKPYIQRDYRMQYQLGSLVERRAISERVGNQAGARYAAERGWDRILGSTGRAMPQGPDSAYWDHATGKLRAIERKGGASRPAFNYFSRQGTNQYHIRAAMRAIRSDKTPFTEKVANARIIKAAQYGQLESAVLRGGYRGTPASPALEAPWDRASVRREAYEIEDRLVRRNTKLQPVFRSAGAAQRADMFNYRLSRGFGAIGLAGAGLLTWDAYDQSSQAWEMWNAHEISGTALPYLQTGHAAAKWGAAGTLGSGSAARWGLLGQGTYKTAGRMVGRLFLPVIIGTELLAAGVDIYQYRSGRINNQTFRRNMIGRGIMGTSIAAGAGVGAAIGVWGGGVGAAPGAAIGATAGAIFGTISVGVANLNWYFVDRQFNAQQQEAKTAAVYEHYGVLR